MDVRRALLERVLQQPVDDVHDVAVVRADFAALAQLQQLLEVEDARGRTLALGILRQLDGALHAVELGQVAVDVDRVGHHALHVAPDHVRQVRRPAVVERLAGSERHLARRHGHGQDAMALGVGAADHLGYRGHVDLHRVDLQVRQLGVAGQPFGQRLQAQRAAGIALVGQLGVGHQHQRMQFHRAAPAAVAHADLLGVLGQQIAIDHQRGQHVVEHQPVMAAEQGHGLR